MITGKVTAVKQSTTKTGKTMLGMLIAGTWYNFVTDYPNNVKAGYTVEFNVMPNPNGASTLVAFGSLKVLKKEAGESSESVSNYNAPSKASNAHVDSLDVDSLIERLGVLFTSIVKTLIEPKNEVEVQPVKKELVKKVKKEPNDSLDDLPY